MPQQLTGAPATAGAAKRAADSATDMVQVVLPNDANPLGYILGGTVMHLIDIAGAIACHRHTRSLLVTAAVLAEAEAIFAPAIALKVDPDAPAADDPYADPQYQVPDDLVW